MRNRPRTVVALLLLLAVSVGAVGVAGADHGEPTDEYDIVEVRTISADGTDRGELRSTHSYHIGEKTRELTVRVVSGERPVETEGFDPTGEEHVYEWDEGTDRPSLTFSVDANRSDSRNDGLATVDTGEWAIVGANTLPRTELKPTALESDIDDIEIAWTTAVAGGEGFAGDGLAYLGEYDRYSFDGGIDVVVSDRADVTADQIDEIGATLTAATDQFSAGSDDEVTAFVVTSPLRLGGLAVGSDFWVHEENLLPETVLYHEFAHTRQQYERTSDVRWTVEGGAEYYALLLALKQGTIEYHEFDERLSRGGEYDDVVLTEPDSWAGTDGDYEQGALVLAALDELIRDSGSGSLEDVFRSANDGEQLTADRFRSLSSTAAGRDLDTFFAEHVQSTPPEIDVPRPTVYDGPNDGAAPTLRPENVTFDADGRTEIPIEIENTGTETSLAPELTADSTGTVELVSADGTVTDVDGGWVFDHLDSGERRRLTIAVEASTAEEATVDLSLEDLSGQGDRAVVSFEQLPAVESTLDGPAEATAGEPVELRATSTATETRIDRYEFRLGTERRNSTDGQLSHTFSAPGSYEIAVTAVTVDGRRGSANASITITEREDQSANGSSDDASPESSDEPTSESTGSDDAIGPGLGVPVAVVALVLTALGRRRET